LTLEGVLTTPDDTPSHNQAAIVIAHPHPLYGGDMQNGVVLALTDELCRLGFPSLRFNFRGVGRSEGRFGDGRGEYEDLRAALNFLGQTTGIDSEKIGLAGYSFGAEIVLRMAAHDRPPRPVLAVSPVVSSVTGKRWQAIPHPKLVICGDSDSFLPVERLVSGTLEEERRIVQGEDHFWMRKMDELADVAGRVFVEAFAPRPAC